MVSEFSGISDSADPTPAKINVVLLSSDALFGWSWLKEKLERKTEAREGCAVTVIPASPAPADNESASSSPQTTHPQEAEGHVGLWLGAAVEATKDLPPENTVVVGKLEGALAALRLAEIAGSSDSPRRYRSVFAVDPLPVDPSINPLFKPDYDPDVMEFCNDAPSKKNAIRNGAEKVVFFIDEKDVASPHSFELSRHCGADKVVFIDRRAAELVKESSPILLALLEEAEVIIGDKPTRNPKSSSLNLTNWRPAPQGTEQ